jgi:RNA polymerase sigma-70 factor, ECF subfamily
MKSGDGIRPVSTYTETMSRSVSTEPACAIDLPVVVRERSFDVLYETLFDFVFRCLRRLGVPSAHTEDACQEVFIVMHRRLCDLRPDASERAFLFGIATRIASQYRKKQARHSGVEWSDQLRASPDAGPFDAAAVAQAAELLERFLGELDEDQRSVFMLMELEDFSAPEVCEALGAKLNTVYSRLRLARARFARFVRAEGLQRD